MTLCLKTVTIVHYKTYESMSNSWWQWVFCFKKVFPQELPHERPVMIAMLSVCSFSFLASFYVNSQAITLPGENFSLTSTQDLRLSSFGEFSETYRLVLNKKWNAPEKLTYFQTFFNKLNFNYFTIFWLTEQSKKKKGIQTISSGHQKEL